MQLFELCTTGIDEFSRSAKPGDDAHHLPKQQLSQALQYENTRKLSARDFPRFSDQNLTRTADFSYRLLSRKVEKSLPLAHHIAYLMNSPTANIKTGHSEQSAFFCSVLYKLTLFKTEETHTVELGFSGGRLLERLMQEPGQVIDRETLIAYAWTNRVVSQGSLNQQVYTLRKILGDEKDPQIIQTVPRRGYRFNPAYMIVAAPEPAVVEHAAPLPVAPVPAPHVPPSTRTKHRKKWTLGMISAAGLAGYVFASLSTQLYAGRLQASPEPEVQQLISHTSALRQRIIGLSNKQVELALVSGKNGYYHIHCSTQAGTSHTISLHDSEIAQVSDQQLRACVE